MCDRERQRENRERKTREYNNLDDFIKMWNMIYQFIKSDRYPASINAPFYDVLVPPFLTAREGELSGPDVTVYYVMVIVTAANKG